VVMHSELDSLEDLLVRSHVTLKLIAMATKLAQSFENFDSHLKVKQTSFQTSKYPFMYTVREEPNLNIKFDCLQHPQSHTRAVKTFEFPSNQQTSISNLANKNLDA